MSREVAHVSITVGCFDAFALAFFRVWIAGGIYVLMAVMRLGPDRRIERVCKVNCPAKDPYY